MTISLLIDMNLTSRWVAYFQQAGYSACHWSAVGRPTDPDATIMAWAVANAHVVFTHDMDFGTALTHAPGPSVLQVRTRGSQPERVGPLVLGVLSRHEAELLAGALIVIDEAKLRVRVLPL